MGTTKHVETIAAGMVFSSADEGFAFSTIGTKGFRPVQRTCTIVCTELSRRKLAVVARVTQVVVVRIVAIALEFKQVCLFIYVRDTFGSVHTYMRPTRTNVQAKFASKTDIAYGTGTMFKVLIVSFIGIILATRNTKLVQKAEILGSLPTNTIVLALQVAFGMILFMLLVELANRTRKVFGTVAAQVTRKRKRIKL